MRPLAPPSDPPSAATYYRAISNARADAAVRTRLTAVEPDLLRAYARYASPTESVVGLAPLKKGPPLDDDLRDNYETDNGAMQTLRARIMARNPKRRCGLCGASRAVTLDHFLPKARFPEYSVLPLNLVPACDPCNRLKSSRYKRDDGTPMFLHAYFDSIPTVERFLFADVEAVGADYVIEFRIDVPRTIDPALAARIESHFEELNLTEVYLWEAVNDLDELRGHLQPLLGDGYDEHFVASDLRSRAAGAATDKGANHWRVALLHGLADCPDFCRYA